jgi:hypothetical protein
VALTTFLVFFNPADFTGSFFVAMWIRGG